MVKNPTIDKWTEDEHTQKKDKNISSKKQSFQTSYASILNQSLGYRNPQLGLLLYRLSIIASTALTTRLSQYSKK